MQRLPDAPSLIIAALLFFATSAFAEDVSALLEEAQRAYLRGDIPTAKEKFGQVQKFEPGNRTAAFNLRRIAAAEAAQRTGKGPPNATQAALAGIVLTKVDFREAGLSEVLEFLRQKGNTLSEGKVVVNFVEQVEDSARNAKVTLTLQNVPFTEVLRYVGELANVQFTFEPYAIVVKPKGATPAPASNASAVQPSKGIKVEGL